MEGPRLNTNWHKWTHELFNMVEIITLILAILSLPFVYPWLCRVLERWRIRKWSVALQFDKGHIPKITNYGFERWHMNFVVDPEGNGANTVETKIINLSNQPLHEVTHPIFGTSSECPSPAEIGLSAKSGKNELSTRIEQWDSQKCRGQAVIELNPPLLPWQALALQWGYRMPNVWREGTEFIQWDVSNPTYELSCHIDIHHSWNVYQPRWVSPSPTDSLPKAILKQNVIKWKIKLPVVGKRYRLEFDLKKPREFRSQKPLA